MKSRIRNAFINSVLGMLSYGFVLAITMATRIAFARILGTELLGLNSLYTSLLQILQIAELGVGTAIIVFLYAPVQNADYEKIKSIMRLYRTIYRLFALSLLALGLIVQFAVLPYIMNLKTLSIGQAQLYFFLFLLAIVSNYVFAYFQSIFYAEQRSKVISIVDAAQRVVIGLMQIVVLFVWKSYFWYLILLIAGYLLGNLTCHLWALKEHPYLREKNVRKLSREEVRAIIDVIKPIFVVRVADKVLGQTNSILINRFIDLVTLGLYSNYSTIFNACLGLFTPAGAALTNSFGNLAVVADAKGKYRAYKKSFAALHFFSVLFCGYFLAFIQDFIRVAYGEEFVMSDSMSVLMTVYLYLSLEKQIYYSYQNAMGLQKLDQKQSIYQVFFNILVSIPLAIYMGIDGIILGTILSLLIFTTSYKGKVLYEHVFEQTARAYFRKTMLDAVRFSVLLMAVYLLTKYYHAADVDALVGKFAVMALLVALGSVLVQWTDGDFAALIKGFLMKIAAKGGIPDDCESTEKGNSICSEPANEHEEQK